MTTISIEYKTESATTIASFYIQKITRLEQIIRDTERENQVLKDNFAQTMTLYNKSEQERKELNSKYLQSVQDTESLKNEVDWLRANQQKNAKHHNKIISELAAEVLRKDELLEFLR